MNLPDTSDENRTACFKDEVVRRYSRICTDWAAKQETIQRHQAAILECQALQEQLGAQGADCEAAARMLGLHLVTEMARHFEAAQNQAQAPLNIPQPAVPPPPIPTPVAPKAPTIKDLVFEIVKQVYPKPAEPEPISLM